MNVVGVVSGDVVGVVSGDVVVVVSDIAGVVTEDFQVKWSGLWTPQYTGTQYITAPADDGVRLLRYQQ